MPSKKAKKTINKKNVIGFYAIASILILSISFISDLGGCYSAIKDLLKEYSPSDFNMTLEPDHYKDVAGNISEIETKVCINGEKNIDTIKLDYVILSEIGENNISVKIPIEKISCPPLECTTKILIDKKLKSGTYIFRVTGTRVSDGLQRNCTFTLVLLPRKSNPPNLLDLSSDISSYTSPPGFPVNLTAKAQDPEGDKIYYKYFLSGPVEDNLHQWASLLPDDVWSENCYFIWNTNKYKQGTYYIGVAVAEFCEGNYIRGEKNWFLEKTYNLSYEEFNETPGPVIPLNETPGPVISLNETPSLVIPLNETPSLVIPLNETPGPVISLNETPGPAIHDNNTPDIPVISRQTISTEDFKEQISNKCIDYERISQRLDTKNVWIADINNSIKYQHKKSAISYVNPTNDNCEIIVTLDENHKPAEVKSILNAEDKSYILKEVSDSAVRDLDKFLCS
jgi:hypothetical protein